MKKTLIAVSIMAGAAGAYAQGEVNWADSQSGMSISILSPSVGTPTTEETGQTALDNPAGATVYTGGYIGGALTGNGTGIGPTPAVGGYDSIDYQNAGNFTAGLYISTSAAGLTAAILTGAPAATAPLLGGFDAGLYSTTVSPYLSGLSIGTPVFVGIAAWYSGGGATSFATSYAESLAGDSVQGYVETDAPVALGGGTGVPASLAGLGLTSFSLAGAVPEPSTIALGVIGASTFLMRLRRKL